MTSDVPDLMSPLATPRLFCDLTQSWSDVGGGVGTYLKHKRSHILDNTPHRHLLIVPGAEDRVVEEGRAITVTVRSPRVPGSPHYRLMLRNGEVRRILEQFKPNLIECQDSYNLPWAAIAHRRRHPETALVAAYMTDFPTVYVARPLSKLVGGVIGRTVGRIGYSYAGFLYRRFDAVFALSENGGATKLRSYGVHDVDVVPLGVELGDFGPSRRDPKLRRSLGLADDEPLLIYVGRLDGEKKPIVAANAFRMLPDDFRGRLVLLGEGPQRAEIEALGDNRILMPGYCRDRQELARWLASADIYVSGMADETFGISIVEAQASGLPVVGVKAGAMIDRVPKQVGKLGKVDDSAAMAKNIAAVWRGDRVAMSMQAQHLARQYSWDSSMEMLFRRTYRDAFQRRAQAQVTSATMPSKAVVQA